MLNSINGITENIINNGGIYLIVAVVSMLLLLTNLNKTNRKRSMLGNRNTKSLSRRRFELVEELNHNIYLILKSKEKDESHNFIMALIWTFIIGSFAFILLGGQWFLAILIPLMIVKGLLILTRAALPDKSSVIDEELPEIIDNTVKVFSRYNNLNEVLFEVSNNHEGELSIDMQTLTRKLVSGNQKDTLLRFAKDMDNQWMYSFIFILVSYTENTSKETVLNNLRNLSTNIKKDNSIKKNKVTDSKYGVVMNNVLLLMAVVGFVVNLIYNPVANEFFFNSFTGILFLLISIISVFGTLFINVKLSNKKRR